jgi:membrane-associated phospholipid phosphatase
MGEAKSNSFPAFIAYLYFGAAILMLVLAMSITKGEEVFWINGNNNPFLDFFFSVITNLGDGLIFIPVIIILLFVRFYYSIIAVIIWIIQGLVCAIIKRGFFRDMDRPRAILDNTRLHFVSNIDVHTNYSFPSGHTATIFCVALFLSLVIKNRIATIGLFFTAVLVGYSRIYLLQHFLIDVAVGALVGCVTTLVFWTLFERNTMPAWMNKALPFRKFF